MSLGHVVIPWELSMYVNATTLDKHTAAEENDPPKKTQKKNEH